MYSLKVPSLKLLCLDKLVPQTYLSWLTDWQNFDEEKEKITELDFHKQAVSIFSWDFFKDKPIDVSWADYIFLTKKDIPNDTFRFLFTEIYKNSLQKREWESNKKDAESKNWYYDPTSKDSESDSEDSSKSKGKYVPNLKKLYGKYASLWKHKTRNPKKEALRHLLTDGHPSVFNDLCIYGDFDLFLLFYKDEFFNEEIIYDVVEKGHYEIFKFLIQKCKREYTFESAIKAACIKGHLSILKYLVNDLKKDFRFDNDECVFYAASYGRLEIVKFLFFKGASVKKLLREAAKNNHINVVRFLLEKKVGTSFQRLRACEAACDLGYFDIVKLLIEYGTRIHRNGESCLFTATIGNHYDIVKLLLDNNSKIKKLMFSYACAKGLVQILKLFIENGACFHKESPNLIHVACIHSRVDVVELLLENGSYSPVHNTIKCLKKKHKKEKTKARKITNLLLKHNKIDEITANEIFTSLRTD